MFTKMLASIRKVCEKCRQFWEKWRLIIRRQWRIIRRRILSLLGWQ